MKSNKVMLVGLGSYPGEVCEFSGERATGYVDIGDGDMTPCHLKKLGPGKLGEDVSIPDEWQDKLNEMRNNSSYLRQKNG